MQRVYQDPLESIYRSMTRIENLTLSMFRNKDQPDTLQDRGAEVVCIAALANAVYETPTGIPRRGQDSVRPVNYGEMTIIKNKPA
jgi:ABC-type uncharacterized transport system ATPase component